MQKSIRLNKGNDARRRRVRIILRPVREAKGLRSVSLPTGRHEVGSDPQCGIHLVAPGIELKHCEITVRRDSVIVRANSRFTWINDGVVREGSLRPGDRLSLGPVEFEVVKPKKRRHSADSAIRPFIRQSEVQRSLKAAIERTEQVIAEHRLRVADHLDHTPAAEEQSRHWQEKIAASQVERALLERRAGLIQELRGDVLRQLGDLIQRETFTAERERNVVEESARLEGRRKSFEDQLASLDQTRSELRTQQERAAHERAEIAIATQDLSSVRERLNEERARIAAESAAVDTARDALNRHVAELDAKARQLDQRSVELDARETAIDAKTSEFSSRMSALDVRSNEIQAWSDGVAATESQRVAERDRQRAEFEQAQEIQRQEIQRERDEIKAEKDSLAWERTALEDLVAATQARKERIDHREQDLAELEAAHSRNQHEIESTRIELDRREAELEARRQQLVSRETEVAVAQEQIGVAEQRQREVAVDRAEVERRAAELKHEADQLEQERASIESERSRLSTTAAELVERETRLAASIEAQESAKNESNSELLRLREELAAGQAGLAREREELSLREAELEARRQELTSRETEITIAQEQIALAEQRQREVAADRDELERRTAGLKHQSERLEEEQASIERERARLAATAADLDEREARLAASIEAQQHSHSESNGELQRLREELGTEQAEMVRERNELAAKRVTLGQEQENLAERQHAMELILANFEARAAEIEKLREHVDRESESLEAAHSRNHHEIESTRNELDRREVELEARRRELVSREAEIAVAQEQISLAEQRHREVAADRAEVERRAAELKHAADQLEEERNSIEGERSRLSAAAADLVEREASLAASIEAQQSADHDTNVELHQLREELSVGRASLARERDELDAARITLDQQQENLAERQRALEQTIANVEVRAAEIEALRERIDRESASLEGLRREYEENWNRSPSAEPATSHEQSPDDATAELHRQIETLQARLVEFEQGVAVERSTWLGERQAFADSEATARDELTSVSTRIAEGDSRCRDLEAEIDAMKAQIIQERDAFDRARESWNAEQDLLLRDRMALEAEWKRLEEHVNRDYSPPPVPTEEPYQEIAAEPEFEAYTPPPIPFDETGEAPQLEQSGEFNSEPQSYDSDYNNPADDQLSADGFQFAHASPTDDQVWNPEAVNSGAPDDVMKLRAELAELFGIQPGGSSGDGSELAAEATEFDESTGAAPTTDEYGEPIACDSPEGYVPGQSDIGVEAPEEGIAQDSLEQAAVPAENVETSFDADPSTSGETNGAEESHEEIMSAYLDRILGRNRDSNEAAVRPKVHHVHEQQPAAETHHDEAEANSPKQPRRLNDEEKVALRANLDSFRELANKQARAAVAKHKSNELKSGVQMTSVISVLIAVVGVVLLTAQFWSNTSYTSWGILALSIAGALGMWTFANSIKIRQLQALQHFAKDDSEGAAAPEQASTGGESSNEAPSADARS